MRRTIHGKMANTNVPLVPKYFLIAKYENLSTNTENKKK
jgi:hypothetical protein